MLSELFKSCFPKSLKDLQISIQNSKHRKLATGQSVNEDHEYFDAVIGLLSVSL
jgi:hypothetical protein